MESTMEAIYTEESKRVGGGDTGLFCGCIPPTKNFELTKDQETAYLQKPLGCPACSSVDVVMGPLQSDGTVAWAENECENCGLLWQDVYNLVGVSVLNLR